MAYAVWTTEGRATDERVGRERRVPGVPLVREAGPRYSVPGDSAESLPAHDSPHLDDLAELAGLSDDDFGHELGKRIVRLAAHSGALAYRLLILIGEFDRRRIWASEGYRDCAAWLEMHTGMSRITARERVRVARKLTDLPRTSRSMARGELSYSKVRARDGGCGFPGCDSRFVEAHHIVPWARGGETKLDNLVLLCRAHHRGVHEGGFRVRMGQGRRPEFLNRIGVRLPDRPPPPALSARAAADPVADLVRTHRFRGIDPHPWSGASRSQPSDPSRSRFREALDPSA